MIYVVVAALIAIADRLVKYFIEKNLEPGETVQFLKGVMDITYLKNDGAAFSMMQGMRWVLAAVTVAAVAAIFIAIFKKVIKSPVEIWSLTAVAGGAVGNLIDRVRCGYVVDMFKVTFVNFAVFNLADCFITVGGIVFCVYLVFVSGKKDKEKEKDGEEDSE